MTDCSSCVPWEPNMSCVDQEEWEQVGDDLKCRATTLAWGALRTLTAGRVGNCPVLMRPCLGDPCEACQAAWQPQSSNGLLYKDGTGCGSGGCSCGPMPEIVMPGEIAEVWQVTIGHYLVDPRIYRVDNGNRLVRMDGAFWPSCQVMSNDVHEEYTMGVWYVPGVKPDAAGLWAAGVLTYEFAKACDSSDSPVGGGLRSCRLPSNVTSLTRQGVSMTFGDGGTSGFVGGGVTGIVEVDTYVASLNPNRLTTPPKVWSPDAPRDGHRYQHSQYQTPGTAYPKAM